MNQIAAKAFPSGQLLEEFKNTDAAVARVIGLFMSLPGIVLLCVGLVGGSEAVRVLGAIAVIVGGVFFAVGTWRKNNRLLVYSDGLVQIKRLKAETHLWRDVQDVIVEQERTYHNLGTYKTVRNSCSLQRKDGGWVRLNAIQITGLDIKAIRRSREAAGMEWGRGQEKWLT
jgi:hypothetical protein